MAHIIPEEKIAEIRDACNIVDLVGEAVLLKKAGRNYLGLCPFHAEKTPSFTVSPDKQMFYCFGCGEGGNVFTFLMKQQALTFPEAVRVLAERNGITLPDEGQTREQKRRWSEREAILELNRLAMGVYRHILQRDPRGEKARAYLADRGFRPEVLNTFNIGFAPTGWDNLTRYFRLRRLSLELAEKAGLVARRKQGDGFYDRFRERIIFPISDHRGQVIGFGGRVVDDSLPKYLNSPETAVYRKSLSLYGLDIAQSHCRTEESVYIVEGYLDVIALHQHGLHNVVGTLGTALTAEHVRRLRTCVGQAGRVVLVFDSDEAGLKAAHRSIGIFVQEFVDARILVLPPGQDPDSFVMQFGSAAFIEQARNAKAIMPFLIDAAIDRHGLSLEGRIKVLEAVAPPMASFQDPVARSVYIKYLAEKVDIDESAIREKLRQQAQSKEGANGSKPPAAGPGGGQPAALPKANRVERQLVAMMLQFPDILPEIRRRNLVSWIEEPSLRTIAAEVLDAGRNVEPADCRLRPDQVDGLDRLRARLCLQQEVWDYAGCLRFIHHFVAVKERRKAAPLVEKIKQAEKDHDEDRWLELLREKQQWIDRVRDNQSKAEGSKDFD